MHWKSRTTSFVVCFLVGLLIAFIYAALFGLPTRRLSSPQEANPPCANTDLAPEKVLADLKSVDVTVRQRVFRRLFLNPTTTSIYYDYERDLNYPERADRARLEYVQLDDSPEAEALLTFVRFEHPVALVFKREPCGWKLAGALGSWLRFEDYPYMNWLSLPESIKPGVHELMVRDSTGDSASYRRKVRLLRLDHDALKQIAEMDEEELEPVTGYRGSDWNDTKRRRTSRFSFVPDRTAQPARIEIEVSEEMVKLFDSAPIHNYWLETDGSWHSQPGHWNERQLKRIKLLGVSRSQLVWNDQEASFLPR